jgi:hypothetical protein
VLYIWNDPGVQDAKNTIKEHGEKQRYANMSQRLSKIVSEKCLLKLPWKR